MIKIPGGIFPKWYLLTCKIYQIRDPAANKRPAATMLKLGVKDVLLGYDRDQTLSSFRFATSILHSAETKCEA